MKRLLQLFTLLICVAPLSAYAAEQKTAIPVQFQGRWVASVKDCTAPWSESSLKIGSDKIRFFESGGPARAIVTQGDLELALIVELFGEGDSWLAYHHFRLSDDRNTLTSLVDEQPRFIRYRCP